MIRKGDVTDIAWVFAWLEMNSLINLQREQERAQQGSTYTYVGSKKEHSKCLLTPT